MYQSKYYSITQRKEILFKEDIDSEAIRDIKRCIEMINRYLGITDYYLMVRDNCLDFMEDSLHNGLGNPDGFIRANRHFLNALNSYYVWQEYAKNNPLNDEEKHLLDAIKREGVLELANRIRNRIVHYAPAITEMSYDVLNERNYITIHPSAYFSEKEQNGFNRKILDYLKNNPKLDAVGFIRDFMSDFTELFNEIGKIVREDYQNWIGCLLKYVPNTPPDCYNSYLVSTDDIEQISVGRTLELLSEKETLLS